MVKLYGLEILFLIPKLNIHEVVEIECECGLFLGYVKKEDLKPTNEPMFECLSCKSKFDFLLKK